VSENLGLKLLYGRAFRTPTLNALLFARSLDTERIESYELELNYTVGQSLELRANFFYNILKDLIEGVRVTGDVVNTGREHIKGVELSFAYSPSANLSLYGSYYNLFDNRSRGVRGRDLANLNELGLIGALETVTEGLQNISPDYVFNMGATYRFMHRYTLGLRLNYASQRKLGDFYTEKGTLSPYLLTDLDFTVGDLLGGHLELALRARNIFDEDFETRGDYPSGVLDGIGRGVYFSAAFKF
jgi:outer membrane receptor protein involved in Fe transport